MKIICIDDSFKPNSISNKHWIVKDSEYTVVKLKRHVLTNTQYFVLEEVQPDDHIYGGYNINRFGLTQEEIDKTLAVKELEEELI